MDKTIVVVAGPTAVGKTEYAVRLAEALDGEVVSCDSMQLYRFLDIGSAKPTKEEMRGIRHHLIDCVDPREPFSVAKYQRMADEAISDVLKRGKVPVIAGGTGLYLDSILYDMDFGPSAKHEEYRREQFEFAEKYGASALHQKLESIDPDSAARIHPNNVKRVVRALEAAEVEGQPLKPFRDGLVPKPGIKPILIGLTRDRQELYRRIDLRVDRMIEAGQVEEVRSLMEKGFTADDIAMKGIGYKELIGALQGDYSVEAAVEMIKRNTRHYAKRQMTWFRRYDTMKWMDLTGNPDPGAVLEEMLEWVSENR